jgi:hypothetical protein
VSDQRQKGRRREPGEDGQIRVDGVIVDLSTFSPSIGQEDGLAGLGVHANEPHEQSGGPV